MYLFDFLVLNMRKSRYVDSIKWSHDNYFSSSDNIILTYDNYFDIVLKKDDTKWSYDNNKNDIIDGSECLKNMDLYFEKFSQNYALTKKSIRVYKKTCMRDFFDNEFTNKQCVTSLIIPAGTHVHLGPKCWSDNNKMQELKYPYQNFKSKQGVLSFDELHEFKCRAQKAYVEKLDVKLSAEKQPMTTSSLFDASFRYRKDMMLQIDKFHGRKIFDGDQVSSQYDHICESGIHFFLDQTTAEKYEH